MVKLLDKEFFFVSLLAMGTLGVAHMYYFNFNFDCDPVLMMIMMVNALLLPALYLSLSCSITWLHYWISLLFFFAKWNCSVWSKLWKINQRLRFHLHSCSDCMRSRYSACTVTSVMQQEASLSSDPSLDILMTFCLGDVIPLLTHSILILILILIWWQEELTLMLYSLCQAQVYLFGKEVPPWCCCSLFKFEKIH